MVGLVLGVGPAAAQDMPKPGPEHEMLKKFEGQWNAKASFGGQESNGTISFKVTLGGFWLLEHYKAELGGMSFEGRGTTGYDPSKKKYIGTWVDSVNPRMMIMEGSFDKDGKLFTSTGDGFMDGKPMKLKSVYEFKDNDNIVFTMYQVADGKDQQLFQINMTRKK
jgi:hypothetical protein